MATVVELEAVVRGLEAEIELIETWLAIGGLDAAVGLEQLTAIRTQLESLHAKLAYAQAALAQARAATSAPIDLALGSETTGLQAKVRLRMDRLATSMAHLYALHRTPLVTVDVENLRDKIARIVVRCKIEGYSAEAFTSAEIRPMESHAFDLFPPLFPERIRAIGELCAASLHIYVEDLDHKTELMETRAIALLPPTTAILKYRDPYSNETVDQTDLLAAWVTPHAPAILDFLRTAADHTKSQAMTGYQTDAAGIRDHVRAIYTALKASEIVYINSTIAFGGTSRETIQRIRLPRESLASRSANCIDGTVLMASLLEATGIDPVLVVVPGHAYLGFRPVKKVDNFEYVETTMIATHSFEEATAVATARTAKATALERIKQVDVRKLRRQGVTPME